MKPGAGAKGVPPCPYPLVAEEGVGDAGAVDRIVPIAFEVEKRVVIPDALDLAVNGQGKGDRGQFFH